MYQFAYLSCTFYGRPCVLLPSACSNIYTTRDCDMWAEGGQCELAPDFMLSFCRKSCGCGSPGSVTSTTGSTSTTASTTTSTRPSSTSTQKTTTIPGYSAARFIFLGGSGHFFLFALSLYCCSRWMQLENRRKTKKSSSKSDKNWANGANLCTRFVTDFYKHDYTGSYRGPWHKNIPLYLTANLTNEEFVIVWSKELNLWTARLMLVTHIPKHAEKFKFYDRTDLNAIYANMAAIFNKLSSFGILKNAYLVVLKRPCPPHHYR